MGIPFYFSYLIKNHKQIISKLESLNFIDNLYLDCNSIIYDSLDFKIFENKSQFENHIIKNVINKIENIITIINPKEKIYIAFDGVPPIAKLNQQKNRRYKSSVQNLMFNKNTPWDTCSITPGTKFMNKLNDVISKHFTKNKKYSSNTIILSLSNEPGEGEHKLYEYIRNNPHSNKNTLIYGMDADLIMLSLNHLKYCNSIYLYRETPHFISSIDNSLDPEEKYLINISELGIQIYKELIDDISIKNDTPQWLKEASNILDLSYNYSNFKNFEKYENYENFYDKIEDYIFMCFLLGNDFMPHFPALNIRYNGFNVLLNLYKTDFGTKKQLIKDGKIVWKNFKLFIEKIANNEEAFLKEIYKIREKQSKKRYTENTIEEKENKYTNLPSFERNIEKFINPYEEDWHYRYYYSLFDVNIDKDKNYVAEVCNNYLQTLQWTYYYYSKECINWNHSYNYHYPPLISDLYKSIPYFDSELVLKEDKNIIHTHLLLSFVLPYNSLNLLPDNIHNYLLKNYEDHYKNDYKIIYAFCRYIWEGHVIFPELNFNEFSKNINKLIL
jgi:5'-3' exonuclease